MEKMNYHRVIFFEYFLSEMVNEMIFLLMNHIDRMFSSYFQISSNLFDALYHVQLKMQIHVMSIVFWANLELEINKENRQVLH
jgi:hypothetical protein